MNEPGALCWNELQSRDVEGSKSFYGDAFGWEAVTHSDGPMPYTEFQVGGQSIAGMMDMPPGVPAEVPTFWMMYFAVDDADATVAKAQQLGAQVLMPAMDIPVGRFAVLADPQGATFAVIKMTQ